MKELYGVATYIGYTALLILLVTFLIPKTNTQLRNGPEHNYWVPTIEQEQWMDSIFESIIIDTVEVIEEEGIRWYTLDTISVSATMYYPVVGQCDDTPDITADQTKIPNIDSCSHLNWIAVSQDLLWFNGGPIRYGDTVYVVAGAKTGQYIVRDAMNKRFKFKIDFLESVGTDLYSFSDAKLLINS